MQVEFSFNQMAESCRTYFTERPLALYVFKRIHQKGFDRNFPL